MWPILLWLWNLLFFIFVMRAFTQTGRRAPKGQEPILQFFRQSQSSLCCCFLFSESPWGASLDLMWSFLHVIPHCTHRHDAMPSWIRITCPAGLADTLNIVFKYQHKVERYDAVIYRRFQDSVNYSCFKTMCLLIAFSS